MSLSYSILGSGAMGSAFGARLRLAGLEVELLYRSPGQSDTINKHGLMAEIDGHSHRVDVAARPVEQASAADAIILFTKSHQIDNALNSLPPALAQTPVITLQNGLGNGEQVASHVGVQNTIEGVSMMPADLLGLGKISSPDPAQTWLYHASGRPSKLVDQIGIDFNCAGINTTVTPQVQQRIWQKACFNIGMNAVCALTQGSPGLLHAFPDGNKLVHELADEALKIATRSGIAVQPNEVHELIDYACANHTYHKPSMLQDLQLNKNTEIEALNGYVVEQADRLAIEVPLNRLICRLMKLREQSPEFWSVEA